MASANEPGTIRIYAQGTSGMKVKLWEGRSDGPINAGKSPDGVLANLTTDKWVYVPQSGPVLNGGVKILVEFQFDGTDGLDVSDGYMYIPLTYVADNSQKILNATDVGNTTDLPAASVGIVNLGTGYTIPAGQRMRFGGGQMVISVEDDTA